jgi:DNA mismatch repair protein MutS
MPRAKTSKPAAITAPTTTATSSTTTAVVENAVVLTNAPAGRKRAARGAPVATTSTVAEGPPQMYLEYLKHYTTALSKYGPKTAVLLQVGSFYELYDTLNVKSGEWAANCQKIAELCVISPGPNANKTPGYESYCWGFPLGACEKYKGMLLGAGYTVVVVSQKKGATGDVTGRVVEDVSSPGLFNGAAVVRREEQILLSVYVEPWTDSRRGASHWYLASTAFDATTGRCVSMETDVTLIDGKPVLDVVTPFWSIYPPVEVCFYWCSAAAAPSEAAIYSMFGGIAGGRPPMLHVYTLDPRDEGGLAAVRLQRAFLEETFHHEAAMSVEEALGVERYHFARRSLYHLLQFVKDHNPSYLQLLNDHRIWTPEDSVLLGNCALEQLGMLPLSAEKEHESLLAWLQKPQTAMGRRTLRERVLTPLADIERLEARQERIAALRAPSAVEAREALEQTLRGSYDLSRLHRKFQLGSAGTDDMLQLLATYERAAALLKATSGTLYGVQDDEEFAALQTHVEWLLGRFSAARIRTSRGQVNDEVAVGSTHPWSRGVHADLDALEDEWAGIERSVLSLKQKMESVLEEADCIKWELRDDTPFLLSTTGRRGTSLATVSGRRLDGVVVTTAKKGSNGSVTLECAPLEAANAAGRLLRSKWKTAVAERWSTELRTWSADTLAAANAVVEFMGRLDAECCLARLSDAYGYVRPSYVESDEAGDGVAGLRIEGLRHPIIERVSRTPYISHNVALGAFAAATAATTSESAAAGAGILLYGVNAAGKSSLGKAIGLAVLMAQTGMPVPATAMTLIPYTGVFTRILGNDNLWAGMSSFVVEMTEFRSILRSAGPRTLVLGDELCAGTETASATSIVAAGVKTLAERGTNFFFATHLHELADIHEIANHPAIRFYHLTVRPSPVAGGPLLYDRKLRAGTGSPMYGLEVCRGLDMDTAFLDTAFEFRRRLFAADGTPRLSRYNAAVVVQTCAVCGAHDALETHHIVPQAAAAAATGHISPGKHKNAADNLVALCGECHDAHHAGALTIKGWIATTAGRALEWERT